MSVVLAGFSALFFGVGDLLGGIAIRRSHQSGAPIVLAMTTTLVSVLLVGIVLLVRPPQAVGVADVVWPVAAGLLMAITRPLLYLGMARGPVAVFAPGFGLTMIVVPAIVGPAIGQRLEAVEVLGVFLAVLAVVLLSGEGRVPRLREVVRSPVIGLAVVVGTGIGVAGIFLTQASPEAGELPAFLLLAAGALVLPVAVRARSGSFWPEPVLRRYGTVLGFTSALAFVLSTAAYLRGSAAVVTALVALCPGVSVAISWRFLGERLYRIQAAGGLLGIAAVVAFAFGA